MKGDPCWDGYEAIGMKEKNGKTVPNCVPKGAASAKEQGAEVSGESEVMLYPVRGRSLRPDRVANAVCGAREVLRRISSPSETPRLPLMLRREAQALLRFFPVRAELHPVMTAAA